MEFINRITEAANPLQIVQELLAGVTGDFDLGVLYVSPGESYDPVELYQEINNQVNVRHLISCSCAGIIGSEQEIEARPCASLMLARLPGVKVTPFYINQITLEGLKTREDWYNFLEVFPNEQATFITLMDQFSFDGNNFLVALNKSYPQAPVIGGLASSATGPGGNVLIINGEASHEGCVGVCLTGRVRVETIVSQGCRPIGKPFIITKAERNVIYELASRPFYKVLEEVLAQGSHQDRQLAREAVFVGLAMNEYKDRFVRGDFLIRAIIAVDPQTGAGAVGDHIHAGQTIQFHVRDARTANEDLHELLKAHNLKKNHSTAPYGAFVFSCNGRGFNLFKQQDHDIKIIQQYLGPIPAAGFFCGGEIGPVGGVNFLHGFTNSTALFYPA